MSGKQKQCTLPNLRLGPQDRRQFFDGCSFLLAHLRASEAKETTFFSGFRDLLGHGNQPLLEPLRFVGLRLLR